MLPIFTEISLLLTAIANTPSCTQQHRESELSYEELYRNAYNLVLQKHAPFLYDNLAHTIRAHMTTLRDMVEESMKVCKLQLFARSLSWQPPCSHLRSKPLLHHCFPCRAQSGGFLTALLQVYSQHFNAMLKIKDVLLYLVSPRSSCAICVFRLGRCPLMCCLHHKFPETTFFNFFGCNLSPPTPGQELRQRPRARV